MRADFFSLERAAINTLLLFVFALIFLLADNVVAAENSVPTAQSPEISSSQQQNEVVDQPLKVLFVLGLNEKVDTQVSREITTYFQDFDVQQIHSDETLNPDYQWPLVDQIVSTGKPGCEAAILAEMSTPLLCTLLTEEVFLQIDPSQEADLTLVRALVIDQPVTRQASIANSVYPALSRYRVFSAAGVEVESSQDNPMISVAQFQSGAHLPSRLSDTLREHDALIATSDSRIYNSSTLSTVLLTAYGFGKPVIGFSRAYVRAGALMTCYSTPEQILRQVAEYITVNTALADANAFGRIIFPEFYSITDNTSIAKSLGLVKEFDFDEEKTYTDADFSK